MGFRKTCSLWSVVVLSLYYILTASETTQHYVYPSGSLPCKTHDTTQMDCSRRSLIDVPILNTTTTTTSITTLDLSHNQLQEIVEAPFEKLHVLLTLNLSRNEISKLSSTAFRGLYSLNQLYLIENKLVELPKNIFNDLVNLTYLDISDNWFVAMPNDALAALHSLEYFHFASYKYIPELDLKGFQNLSKLNELRLEYVYHHSTNITRNTFRQLAYLPLHTLDVTCHSYCNVDKDTFSPLDHVTKLAIPFEAIPALQSLQSPLNHLSIHLPAVHDKEFLDNTTFRDLQRWNSSLTYLNVKVHFEEGLLVIKDYTFIWTPGLRTLDLARNGIAHLEKHAFHGLMTLEVLVLSRNSLSMPLAALDVFKKYVSLKHIELASNFISNIPKDAFSAVSPSLTYLDLDDNIIDGVTPTEWLHVLQKLKYVSFSGNDYGYGTEVASISTLRSLRTININRAVVLYFKRRPLCSLFPSLEVANITDATISRFPSSLALDECSHLSHLDLSGSVNKIHLSPLGPFTINISGLVTLLMSRNQLTSIKQVFFFKTPKLTSLDVSGNQIQIIDSSIVHVFPHIKNLNVANNVLTSITGIAHLIFLNSLNAADNQLTIVPSWLFDANKFAFKTLILSNNPFTCSCDIEPFRKWILSDIDTWLFTGKYVCATPESLVGVSITAIELDCASLTPFYLGISIPFIVCLCVIIIFLIKYRWHIKYRLFLLYRNYHTFPDINNDFEMLDLNYHAYVAYDETSAADEAWVINDLRPNMEDDPEPLHLCIKTRDFMPGSILDNIDNGIRQSRKTILVLSPSFMESNWCYQEMQMAQLRFLDDNLDILILVMLDDIPETRKTLSLRQILCRKEYLKWPKNNRIGQKLFWKRLRLEVMGPIRVERCLYL